jgi:hypothetical protein
MITKNKMSYIDRCIEMLEEVTRQDRIIYLRLKYRYCENEQWKGILKKHIESLLSQCKDKKFVSEFEF